ncbi:MAG: hypothetical protein IJE68_02380 [Clostridia bacterium]|nr:hypothetical protein [Clostridia bacterium]
MLIKRDRNEELEKILEQKNVDEQAKNLLQGILYKVEVSYKDYQKVKSKKQTEEKYVEEILENIQKRCDKISVAKLRQKLADEEIQKELEKNKYYVGDEIVSYPIEEKILYAIEKKSRYPKILNNKYVEATIAISNLINTGKCMDRVEVLRDFNGWSWTTIKKELENIEANLIYQTLQIVLGEEFLDNWTKDKDGIIDYLELITEKITDQYTHEMSETAEQMKDLLTKISMSNTAKNNEQFAQSISQKIQNINQEIENYEDTQQKIVQMTNYKKNLLKELNKIEQILGQSSKLKNEYEKRNEEASIDQKIFNIRVFKKQLEKQKQQLIEEIEKQNYLLNPSNYLEEKNKLIEQKKHLQLAQLNEKEVENLLIEFLEKVLKCFKTLIKQTKEDEEIVKLIYQFRYFMLLPFNLEKSVKDIDSLQKSIIDTEKKLTQKAIKQKVMVDVPFEIMRHVFETRIIILEELYYKITAKSEKHYVQIFDENVSEEKFEITPIEKTKINKKIKIFI